MGFKKRKTAGCDFQDQAHLRQVSGYIPDAVTDRVEWLVQEVCKHRLTPEAAFKLYKEIPAWELPVEEENEDEP